MATITVDYTAYTWWMATWNKNEVVCSLVVDHEGQPTLGEIYQNCDPDVYFTFKDQPSCNAVGDRRRCEGYYLVLIDTTQSQRQMTVTAAARGSLAFAGRMRFGFEGRHQHLRERADPGAARAGAAAERAYPAHRRHDGRPAVQLRRHLQTEAVANRRQDGVDLQFWAWSSYGDSSQVFTRKCAWRSR